MVIMQRETEPIQTTPEELPAASEGGAGESLVSPLNFATTGAGVVGGIIAVGATLLDAPLIATIGVVLAAIGAGVKFASLMTRH